MSAMIDARIADTKSLIGQIDARITKVQEALAFVNALNMPASFKQPAFFADVHKVQDGLHMTVDRLVDIRERLTANMAKLEKEKARGPTLRQQLSRAIGGNRAYESEERRLEVVFATVVDPIKVYDILERKRIPLTGAYTEKGRSPKNVIVFTSADTERVREAIEDNLGVRIVEINELYGPASRVKGNIRSVNVRMTGKGATVYTKRTSRDDRWTS